MVYLLVGHNFLRLSPFFITSCLMKFERHRLDEEILIFWFTHYVSAPFDLHVFLVGEICCVKKS